MAENKDRVKEAAVKVLDENGSMSLGDAIEEVVNRTDCNEDRARVNLLVISQQKRSGGRTELTLADGMTADSFLTDDVADDNKSEDVDDDEGESENSLPKAVREARAEYQHESVWRSTSEILDAASDRIADSPPPTDEKWHHLHVRKDDDHPLVYDVPGYIEQEYSDGVKDVEHFTFLAADPDFGVALIGEPGTGKGHMVKYVAAKCNIPLVRINMGTRVTKEKLVGAWVPNSNGGDVTQMLKEAKNLAEEDPELTVGKALDLLGVKDKFRWKDGLFTLAYRHGWWILVDEMNAADARTLMPFFGALEDKDSRSLELTEKSETIRPHPGFKFIATMNPTHHEGTNRTNDALDDRMHYMKKSYLPQKKEADLLVAKEGISQSLANDLVRFAGDIRNAYPKEISQTLTPRGLFRIARYTKLYGPQEAARQELLARCEDEDQKNAFERKIEGTLDEQ